MTKHYEPGGEGLAERNVYRLQMSGVRLCDALRLIADYREDDSAVVRRLAGIAAKALAHNEPDPKDWTTALRTQGDAADVAEMRELRIVFDGPPGPKSGRFVEVETDGRSVDAGVWHERADGLWELRIKGGDYGRA